MSADRSDLKRDAHVADEDTKVIRCLATFEADVEASKSRLIQTLHDELGGHLVAAVMDLSWAESRIERGSDVAARLGSIRQTLTTAILLKRQLIEQLCPTLIEHVGLISAVRWYYRQTCEEANLKSDASYPAEETPLAPAAAKILFRIVEEALNLVTRQQTAKCAHLSIDTAPDQMAIRLIHDGEALAMDTRSHADLTSLWLVDLRVRALGGSVSFKHPTSGGMVLEAEVPLAKIQLQ